MKRHVWTAARAVAGAAISLAGLSAAWAGDFSLANWPTYLTTPVEGGKQIAIGDANNDGRDDLVVIAQPQTPPIPTRVYDYVSVRLQKADATLPATIGLALPMTDIRAVQVADLEGDGQNEIIAGYDGGIMVYRWNNVEFVPTAVNSSFGCTLMDIADLDGNGTRDILCVSTQQAASIYRVDAEGHVGTPSYVAMASPSASAQLKLDDVTGDGRPDALMISAGVWAFFMYPNDGAGGLLPAQAYAYSNMGFTASAIEAFDVDGDGANEIVIGVNCNSPCSRLFVYRRDATGMFQLQNQIPTLDLPATLEKYDVDSDGYLDLLVGHSGWDAVGRYPGGAHGMSTTEILTRAIRVGGLGTYLAAGDLNSDGRNDVAANNYSLQAVIAYGMGRRRHDISGNYQSDLFWRNASTGQNSLWRDGNSAWAQIPPSVALPWTVAAIADFNNDDKGDVFWRNPSNGANMIWLSGDATTLQATIPLGVDWQVAGSGDFDGDHRADLLWRNAKTGENLLWFAARNDLSLAIRQVSDVRWQVAGIGDVDGDHRADIVWRHSASGANSVWFSADATTAVALVSVPNPAWKIAGVGDFNLDGMDDLLWRNVQTGQNSIWRSANAAMSQTLFSVPVAGWTIATVGDFFSDGRDDIVWRNTANGTNTIWHGADPAQAQTITPVGGTAWRIVP